MSSEPPQRTSTLSAQEMSGHVGQCRQDTSSNSVLETLSEGHSVDIRGIYGHFMDICGHLRTSYLNFAACPDKLACPQGVLSEDMSRTCPGQMKLRVLRDKIADFLGPPGLRSPPPTAKLLELESRMD
jgi:hypothetical protein